MRKTLTAVPIGDHVKGRTRHAVRLEDEVEVESGSVQARTRMYVMLQELVDQPALLACGPAYPEDIRMHHDGQRWVIEAMAESLDA